MSLFIYCSSSSFKCEVVVIEVNYTSKSKQLFTIPKENSLKTAWKARTLAFRRIFFRGFWGFAQMRNAAKI